MSLLNSSNIFNFLLNFKFTVENRIDIKNAIDKLCEPSNSIEDLFTFKFCPALKNGFITLKNIDSYLKSSVNITIENISNIESLGIDFIDHENSTNVKLKSILFEEEIEFIVDPQIEYYSKYCNYLNRLVIFIIVHREKYLKTMPLFSSTISTLDQSLILELYNKLPLNIKNSYSILKTPSLTTVELVDYLTQTKPLVKMDIKYDHFKKLILDSNLSGFELLVRYCSDGNIESQNCLFYCAEHGHVSYLRVLIHHGANIEYRDENGITALMTASMNDQPECVELLLKNNALIDSTDLDGWSALMLAAYNDSASSILKLIEHNANIDMQNAMEFTALMYAAQEGYLASLTVLLNHNAIVDLRNHEGITSLMLAARKGHLDCLTLLLEYGANSNINNYILGWNPLMYANENGYYECLKYLIENGGDMNVYNDHGGTLLLMSSLNGDTYNLIDTIKYYITLDKIEEYHIQSLIDKSEGEYNECIKILLEYGAEIKFQGEYQKY